MRNTIAPTDYNFEGLMDQLEADYKDGAPGVEYLVTRAAEDCSDEEWSRVVAVVGWSEVRYYSSRPTISDL